MSRLDKTLLTPQAQRIYELLQLHSRPLTAAEIAAELGVLAPTVYRAARQLIEFGLAKATRSYPLRYRLIPSEQALAWYMLAARKEFLQEFPATRMGRKRGTDGPSIKFIHNRTALLAETDRDVALATKMVDFIVSGLVVPDATVLAYRRAIARGARVRALLQKRHETDQAIRENWHSFGVETRLTDDMSLRLFIIDKHIVYLTSYSQHEKEKAFGIRFSYPPVAAAMSELFEEKWRSAIPL